MRTAASREGDQTRQDELLKMAANCRRVPEQPATTWWEALQSFWFVQLILQIESSGHSISPGRFDQYMYPYLEGDKNISRDFAQELLDNIWIKFNDLNKTRDAVSDQPLQAMRFSRISSAAARMKMASMRRIPYRT